MTPHLTNLVKFLGCLIMLNLKTCDNNSTPDANLTLRFSTMTAWLSLTNL
ncbi:hypothetical protein PLAN_100623 [Planktothrix rubescens CCAP 1459/22]|uniref:Uncharacterized protein n=2 Tax=Planktothrix TaxID=54304 RepID=A0A1J1JGQ1_PLAAG|nr:hypothetical protein PLAN_100623 [Planktothrix rubescens NIVA-CYA 18]CAD0224206.1 conserved hypothetical protein [Planktothrix agardhii]CUM60293.1 protein of unknown function [Planktothrix agardhii]